MKGKDIVKRLIIILLGIGYGLWAIGHGSLAMAQEDSLEMVLDTAIMAPMQVKGIGVNNYDELSRMPSSLDLQDPENVNTTIEYDPLTGGYVLRSSYRG